jgi:hypothetical protein
MNARSTTYHQEQQFDEPLFNWHRGKIGTHVWLLHGIQDVCRYSYLKANQGVKLTVNSLASLLVDGFRGRSTTKLFDDLKKGFEQLPPSGRSTN